MKRICAFILAVMLTVSLTACGSSRDQSVNMIEQDGVISVDDAEPEDTVSEPGESEQEDAGETPPAESDVKLPDPAETTSAKQETPKSAASKAEDAPASKTETKSATQSKADEQPVNRPYSSSDEMKAIWISYLDLEGLLYQKSESAFTKNIGAAFDNILDFGLNTVYVQVRPFGDALYSSDYFPWSYTITGTEGKNPGFDPLEIMVNEAHQRGLKIEAWLNPYRVRTSNKPLSADNQAKIWLDEGHEGAIKFNGNVYYNPASEEARSLIVSGVEEIVSGYDVDGIHFDDYFYPTTDAAFDSSSYKQYKNGGGKLSLGDWRRENVNLLVKDVYVTIKSINSSVRFGISPQGNTKNNYDAQYIDVEKWLSNTGYVDYICPQIYFGFDNAGSPYQQTVDKWNSMVKAKGIDLYIGLAAYKVGTVDEWAGAGKNEWKNTNDMLKRMVEASRDAGKCGGFALYRYDSLFKQPGSQMNKEKDSLQDVL